MGIEPEEVGVESYRQFSQSTLCRRFPASLTFVAELRRTRIATARKLAARLPGRLTEPHMPARQQRNVSLYTLLMRIPGYPMMISRRALNASE